MSTTINLINFDKQLAGDNFNDLISGNCDFINSFNDNEQLKNYLSELGSEYEASELMAILRMIYLYCGSLFNICVASPLGDYQHINEIETFSEYYKLDVDSDNDIPTKNGFIELYRKITEKDINNITHIFLNKIDYDFQDGKYELIYTLKYLRPFVVSLKDNPKSFMVVEIDHNVPEVSPQEINEYIINKIEEAGSIQYLVKKINMNT